MKFFFIIPIMFVFVLLLGTSKVQASECYDHWNGDAWHGTGAWAMVMCLDTREYVTCSVRKHSDGSVIKDLHPHIAEDRGRKIWTTYDYNISVPYVGQTLDLLCRDPDGLTYTYTFVNKLGFIWGACGLGTDTGGAACVNDQNEKILTVSLDGNGTGTVTRSSSGLKCTSGKAGKSCYHSPSSLTITAVPAAGNIFRGWSGGGCTGTSSTCKLDMSKDQNVTATFVKVATASPNYLLLK